MKILDKSLKIAKSLFPSRYESHKVGQSYHFTFAFHRNKLIAIGQNNSNRIDAKEVYFAKRFNLKKRQEFAFAHSETNAIGKLWSRYHIDSSIRLVNLRLNRYGELRDSKPCNECKIVLDALGIDEIYYSTNEGFIKL